MPRMHSHACVPSSLISASTVPPVCDSETGEDMAMCAYPAGIDLATGEGVFVSPHFAGVSLVSGRSMRSFVGRRAFVVVAALDFEFCQGERCAESAIVGSGSREAPCWHAT